MSRPQRIEPVIFGMSGVGKSCIARQFSYSRFIETGDASTEGPYRKKIVVEQKECVLELVDTHSTEEFKSMEDHLIQAGDGYILVYSITSKASFEEIRSIHARIRQARQNCRPDEYPNISMDTWKSGPMMLVANKADSEQREVSTQEGKELAEELGIDFMELTAKDTEAVGKMVGDSVKLILKYQIQLDQAQSALARQATEATLEQTSSDEEKPQKRRLSTLLKSSLGKLKVSGLRSSSKRGTILASA